MKVYGIDFTSRPKRGKPITCLECVLEEGDLLQAGRLSEWPCFKEFEAALQKPGPWIAGIDLPFGQSRTFIENIDWPKTWPGYVDHVRTLGREGFRAALDEYKRHRSVGDKEHLRATDVAAGSISPQKQYGTPVGLMFFEGAPRLLDAGVTIPGLQDGDPGRIVVEAYPGVLARRLIGKRSYKQDTKKKQTEKRKTARQDLMRAVLGDKVREDYGLRVNAPMSLADDPTGDRLDALLCSIQAAWAWLNLKNFGAPSRADPLEGWIADPAIRSHSLWISKVTRTVPRPAPQSTSIDRSPDGTIKNADKLTANEVANQKVLCPACQAMTFKKWPEGWDAHAAFKCSGLAGTQEQRKAIFKHKHRHLFR